MLAPSMMGSRICRDSTLACGTAPCPNRPSSPIEFVMNSKNLRKPEKGVEWNPTLPALELGSATGFTKGTIIPQKPPADDNLERWRDAAYSFRHTPRVTPLRRTGQLLDGWQPGNYRYPHVRLLGKLAATP